MMSSIRECVEWGFASVIQHFPFLDFSKQSQFFDIDVFWKTEDSLNGSIRSISKNVTAFALLQTIPLPYFTS
jgi:hypothetical protein